VPEKKRPRRRARTIVASVLAVAVATTAAVVVKQATTSSPLTGTVAVTCHAVSDHVGTGNACWNCHQAVDLDSVTVDVPVSTFSMDAVGLGSGCSGHIGYIRSNTASGDCLKTQSITSTLTVDSGLCTSTGLFPGQHLDCWQDLGSQHLHLSNFVFDCPDATNGQAYISYNKQASPLVYSSDVTCDQCEFHPGPNSFHGVTLDHSDASGFSNSLICPGTAKNLQFLVTAATNVIDVNNAKPWPASADPRCS
jgi:hypothetical protein